LPLSRWDPELRGIPERVTLLACGGHLIAACSIPWRNCADMCACDCGPVLLALAPGSSSWQVATDMAVGQQCLAWTDSVRWLFSLPLA
jgi:hypothetical protein